MEHHGYQTYGSRWWMLLLGFVINFALFALEQPLTPSASVAAARLGVATSAIHWLKYAWSITAVLAGIPGLLLMERRGLRWTAALATGALLLGSALRTVERAIRVGDDGAQGSGAFGWLLIGSIVASLGVIPIQASTTLIAASWFDDEQRGLANTLVRPAPFARARAAAMLTSGSLSCLPVRA